MTMKMRVIVIFLRFGVEDANTRVMSKTCYNFKIVEMRKNIYLFPVLLCFALFSISTQGYSKYSGISFERLGVEDGLSHPSVLSFTQDAKGFIWVGCQYGLNKYDGVSIYNYTTSSADFPYTVSKNNIQSLLNDKNNRLWIGMGADLHLLDQSLGTFQSFNYNDNNPVKVNSHVVKTLFLDTQQNVWMGTSTGVVRVVEKNNEIDFTHYHVIKNNEKASIGYVNSIVEDGKGDIWAATREGLYFLDNKVKQTFVKIDNVPKYQPFLPNASLSKLIVDNKGYVWALGNRFFRIEKESTPDTFSFKTIYELSNDEHSFLGIFVRDAVQTNDGYFWLTTNHGLYILGLPEYTGKNKVEHFVYQNDNTKASSLSHNILTTVFIDNSGVLWIGSINGLNMFDYSKHKFKQELFKEVYETVSPDIRSMCRDKYGNYWFGTFSHGLIYQNASTGEVKHIFQEMFIDKVFAICEDDDGVFWLGINQMNWGGLIKMKLPSDYSKFDIDDIEFERIDLLPHISSGNFRNVSGIKKNSHGDIWISEGSTTIKMTCKGNRRDSEPVFNEINYFKNTIPSLMVDFDSIGNVWICSKQGQLSVYNYETNSVSSFNDSLSIYPGLIQFNNSILIDAEQKVWLGTNGEGVSIIDIRNRSILQLNTRSGLSSNIVMGITEQGKNIWISTIHGISRVDKESLIITNYNKNDGLSDIHFNANSLLNEDNNKLFFGSVAGLNIYDYASVSYYLPSPPKVEIVEIAIKNKVIRYHDRENVYINRPVEYIDTLKLSYNDYPMTIKMSALLFASPEKIRYKYKLQGFDDDWVETTQNFPYASYGRLAGGVYELSIQASGFDGEWGDERNLLIIVQRPFWEKIWFRLVVIIALVALVFLILHARTKVIRSKNIELEKTVSERKSELFKSNMALTKQTSELRRVNALLELRQNELEEQAKKTEAQKDCLVIANAAKDKLFTIVSHDLRSPFNSIMGFAEILHEKLDDLSKNKIAYMSSTIYKNAKAYLDLLEKLLQWAKTQTGSITFSPTHINVCQIITHQLIIFEQEAKDKGISLINTIPVDLKMYADYNMIDTIFRNLIGNAIKFTENGSVSILFHEGLTHYEFCIKDSGIGISKENIQKLFNLSANFTTQGTNNEKGSGLGLLICKEFVCYHQGEIWVESNSEKNSTDRGTTFYFTCNKNLSENGIES